MKDGIPKGTGNSRFLKAGIPSNITLKQMVDMLRAGTFPVDFKGINPDGWDVTGTPVNKQTLLPDTVCDVLRIDRVTSTVGEALLAVPCLLGTALLRIKALQWDGTPYARQWVTGLTGIASERRYTDENGELNVYINEGHYAISLQDKYFDTDFPTYDVKVSAGQLISITIQERKKANAEGMITILDSATKCFSQRVRALDALLIGAGGRGGNGGDGGKTVTPATAVTDGDTDGGGGGAGGQGGSHGSIKDRMDIQITPDKQYPLIIGANGGATKGFDLEAPGGTNGATGKDGGDCDGVTNSSIHPGSGEAGTVANDPNAGGNGGNGTAGDSEQDAQKGSVGKDTSTIFYWNATKRITLKDGNGGGGGSGGSGVLEDEPELTLYYNYSEVYNGPDGKPGTTTGGQGHNSQDYTFHPYGDVTATITCTRKGTGNGGDSGDLKTNNGGGSGGQGAVYIIHRKETQKDARGGAGGKGAEVTGYAEMGNGGHGGGGGGGAGGSHATSMFDDKTIEVEGGAGGKGQPTRGAILLRLYYR